jgi:hypothetical protein
MKDLGDENKTAFQEQFKAGTIILLSTAAFDEAILVLIIISTIKCISNYGMGFMEIMQKQLEGKGGNDKIRPVL